VDAAHELAELLLALALAQALVAAWGTGQPVCRACALVRAVVPVAGAAVVAVAAARLPPSGRIVRRRRRCDGPFGASSFFAAGRGRELRFSSRNAPSCPLAGRASAPRGDRGESSTVVGGSSAFFVAPSQWRALHDQSFDGVLAN